MKQRELLTMADLDKAANDLLNLESSLPLVLTLTAGNKIRSTGQNSRYWANVRTLLDEIKDAVQSVAEHTGHTPLEVKRILAGSLEPEQIGVLYARKSDTIHEILKQICSIPTSTRLGTRDFIKFEDVLEGTIAEIIGNIRAVVREALN